MSQTFEHAIGDDATASHELGHAVAARLQRLLKGSTVESAGAAASGMCAPP